MHDLSSPIVSQPVPPTAAEYQYFLKSAADGYCLVRFAHAVDVRTAQDDAALVAAISAGVVADCNDAFARMYGHPQAAALIGQPIESLVRWEEPANAAWIITLRDRHFAVRDLRTQQTDSAGRDRFFAIDLVGDVSGGAVSGGDVSGGALQSLWWTQRDVTAGTTAERDSQHLRNEVSRTVAGFLSMVTHELRKPLTPALLLVSYLESRTDVSDELREDAQLIRQSIEAQSSLIGELSDVSSLSSGRLTLDLSPHDVHELLRSVVSSADRSEAARTSLDLQADDAIARIEPARLRQAVLAVLASAWRCSTRGSRTLVHSRNVGPALEISVSHEGVGYEAPRLARMFDAFDASDRHRGSQGLGLDLVLARGFVHAMGGRLTVASDGAECGATFTFSLPLATVASVINESSNGVSVNVSNDVGEDLIKEIPCDPASDSVR